MSNTLTQSLPHLLLTRDGAAAAFAFVGTILGTFCFSLDMYGGAPGLGRSQLALLGMSAIAFGGATLLKYARRDRIAELTRFVSIGVQLVLLALVLYRFKIAEASFYEFVLGLSVVGFFGNHFMPRPVRPAFFLLLSLAGMFGILKPLGGLLMLVAGLGIVGIAHMPIAMWVRAVLLTGVAVLFGLVQTRVIETPYLATLIPILPSIFMFRMVIYLYDTAHGKGPKDWPSRISYFFMLPNFVFPFFPVVDFAQWGRNYYAKQDMQIYEAGVRWILLGTVHLILYRFVNYYLVIDPASVDGFASFLAYCVVNFALYLKVSGLFHLILGLLHLFGHHLPETHSRYYLSFSFIELWRRINIYWKDFMQKTVFNPVFAWSKSRGAQHMQAIVIAIGAVFFVTWATHAYQWFWLRGGLFLTIPDALFWGILGVMLIIQTVEESRPAKTDARAHIGPRTLRVIRTVAMMLLLTILWAMWSSASWSEWTALLAASGFTLLDPHAEVTAMGVLQSVAFAGFLFMLGAISTGYTFGLAPRGSHPAPRRLAAKSTNGRDRAIVTATTYAACIGLLALTLPETRANLSTSAQRFIVDMQRVRLSSVDQGRLERGYYENLTGVSLTNSELWDYQQRVPPAWKILEETTIARHVDDYRGYVLFPNMTIIHKGAMLTTNSVGMHDHEYSIAKPAGMVRIAVLGSSRAMGIGVEMDQTFENLIESRINGELPISAEVLNFSVAGYDAFQKMMVLEQDASKYAPDVLVYIAHQNDITVDHNLARQVGSVPMPFSYMDDILVKAGVTGDMDRETIERRLQPFTADLSDAAFKQFATLAAQMDATPVVIYLPSVSPREDTDAKLAALRASAQDAGIVYVDLAGMFDDLDYEKLRIAPWDDHPNALGHKIIADRMYSELMDIPAFRLALGLD